MYNPIDDLASSLHAALLRDLPAVSFRDRDWDAWSKIPIGDRKLRMIRYKKGEKSAVPTTMKTRRPYKSEVAITMFLQTWPTGALGFAFKANVQEETHAYTVIVEHEGAHAVYFGGKFAYVVMDSHAGGRRTDPAWTNFLKDMAKRKLVDCGDAVEQYRAVAINKYGSASPNQPEAEQDDDS